MRKKTPPKDILQEIIKKSEENILLLSKWSDKDLKERAKNLCIAREEAYEDNNFVSYKILGEKLLQVSKAQDLKFSLTDEASEWIHW